MADPMTVTMAAVAATGGLGWAAYITKQITEHAKWMSAATVSLARLNANADEVDRAARAAAEIVKQQALITALQLRENPA